MLVPTLTGAAFAASGGRLVCPLPMSPPPIESCSSPNAGDYNRNPRDDTAQLAPTISRTHCPDARHLAERVAGTPRAVGSVVAQQGPRPCGQHVQNLRPGRGQTGIGSAEHREASSDTGQKSFSNSSFGVFLSVSRQAISALFPPIIHAASVLSDAL